ncbi:hypothetical protein [Vagococcus fessus]|uniref:hypothetical protein n=1 Tax=Vagococcus fessus TaxID=120370 RepID=UPI001473C3D9|nr:hypothetical protein [Vagococcus fessus]
MRNETIAYLRADLWDYNKFKKEILAFQEAILNSGSKVDENIGGGRSSFISDPTAVAAIKLASPDDLSVSVFTVNTIDDLLSSCSKEHYDVIMSKYINGYRGKKNAIVSSECKMSESTVKRKDLEFLELLRIRLRRR